MTKYRTNLPQRSNKLFLTDGGIETTLIFHEGFDLPYFAAFTLLGSDKGRSALRDYYRRYASIAVRSSLGFVLESPTWRASTDWGAKLGYSETGMAEVNRDSIRLMSELRDEFETERSPMVISGCIGPRGDGYDPGKMMTADEAEAYHGMQAGVFAQTEADMVTAITMTYAEEAIGLTRAAVAAGMPVAISFTVETDGRLPTGQPLKEAVEMVDDATGRAPAYFMINCAHPTHFEHILRDREPWVHRLRGVRANASTRSHAELDQATDLDDGDPVALGREYATLRRMLPGLTVLGGCCGTDHRHVEAICHSCAAPAHAVRAA